ncbi:hypothetical protein [Kalamiella sp. sgz302252]|uniref:hypothetical protein n=1 Tax=Pantoea sp. sgz302252 TaxID=3341827 RepID=UPI0036D25B76
MNVTDAIALSVVTHAGKLTQTRSEVLLNGSSTGLLVAGKVPEAAVQVADNRYLLFITDDVIFEESLNVILIDLTLGILDRLELGQQYATGSFADLCLEANSASFRFIGDNLWTVSILTRPALRLPFSDPAGVSRPVGFKKYLRISVRAE